MDDSHEIFEAKISVWSKASVHVKEFIADCPPILFKFSNHYLHFGREEFCLVTGFRCGELSEYVSDKIGFLDRLFRIKDKKQQKKIKVKELWQIIDNEKLRCALDDEDAVRVSLLFVLEIVFMGQEEFLNVPLHIWTLAEDFFAWNSFPWGEYMCRYFYKKTLNVVKIHAEKKDPKKMTTYNLNGFVWPLKDSIPNLVMLPTSGELKVDWWVRSQYRFKEEDAPFIQSVKSKCIDFQRCDSNVVDYVNDVQEDCTLVEQTKKPSCSTPVQVDAVINQGVPLVQGTPHVLGNVGSSYKGLLEPKIIDTVDLLCKQLIDIRPEMEGIVDQLKSKVIDTLTTTLESARKHAKVVEAEVANHETNSVKCSLVEKDVRVLSVAVDSCDMNLVDCPVVHKENLEPSKMEHLVNAYAFVSHPLSFYDSLKDDKCVEPAQDTNDTNDDYIDFENNPSQYCLDNMTICIEKDTQNGELTVSLYEQPQKETTKCFEHIEKMGLRGQDKQIANENSDFDTLLKVK
nr:hypothetical protein [Tanacetum cinerariifolium]